MVAADRGGSVFDELVRGGDATEAAMYGGGLLLLAIVFFVAGAMGGKQAKTEKAEPPSP